MTAANASTLTSGTYSGNGVAAAEIRGGTVAATGTWVDLGVATDYDVAAEIYIEGPTSPVLTIEQDVTITFAEATGIYVSYNSQPGGLILDGSENHPVVLTGKGKSPGSWSGVALCKASPIRTSPTWPEQSRKKAYRPSFSPVGRDSIPMAALGGSLRVCRHGTDAIDRHLAPSTEDKADRQHHLLGDDERRPGHDLVERDAHPAGRDVSETGRE